MRQVYWQKEDNPPANLKLYNPVFSLAKTLEGWTENLLSNIKEIKTNEFF